MEYDYGMMPDDGDSHGMAGASSSRRVGPLSKETATGTMWKTLVFLNETLETTYQVWTSQNSVDLVLRIHALLIIGWFVGWIQSSNVIWFHAARPSRAILVNIIQASVVAHETMLVKRILSDKSIESQARQHAVKAKMHAFLHLATTAMVIISSQTLFDSRWHALSTIFLTYLSIVDQLPLYHLIKLQLVKMACFGLLFFARICMDRTSEYLVHQVGDALMLLVMGTVVPLSVAAYFEYRHRVIFLHDMDQRDTQNLWGSFWRFCEWIGL